MLFAVRVLTIVMIERQTLFYIVHAVFLKKVWGRQKFSFATPGKLSDANTCMWFGQNLISQLT